MSDLVDSIYDKQPSILLYAKDWEYLKDLEYLIRMIYLNKLINLRELRYPGDFSDFSITRKLIDFSLFGPLMVKHFLQGLGNPSYYSRVRHSRDLLYLQYLSGVNLKKIGYISYLSYLRGLSDLLDKEQSISILSCMQEKQNEHIGIALLALYSMITKYYNNSLPTQAKQNVQNFLQRCESQLQQTSLASEARFLIVAIRRWLDEPVSVVKHISSFQFAHGTADERATQLAALRQQRQLDERDIKEVLGGCIDTREISVDKWRELGLRERGTVPGVVGEIAWNLLMQRFEMKDEGVGLVVEALDDSDAIVCAAAALLLQQGKRITLERRKEAVQKIIAILRDEELSRRPLNPPGYDRMKRLDDVLFETLRMLEK